MITEYRVVLSQDLREFDKTVNNLLVAGWQPQGGMFRDNSRYYFQAMVKIVQI